jgi:hypothetical protein
MISAAAIVMTGALDKFFIDLKYSKEDLGQYFYTYSIASIPALMVSFTVGMTIWPQCIKLRANEKFHEYKKKWIQLGLLYFLIIFSLSLILYFGVLIIEVHLKGSFDRSLFGLLLLACGTMALIEPLKLRIYLESMDLQLAYLNFIHFIIAFLVVLIFSYWNNLYMIAAGLIFSNILAIMGFYLKMPISFNLNKI